MQEFCSEKNTPYMTRHIFPLITCILLAASCSHRATDAASGDLLLPVHPETNAVYYWKTVFNPGPEELDFLDTHNINRIYIRMFDVVDDIFAYNYADRVIPNATIKFSSSAEYILKYKLTDLQFVPVVYITLDALKAMSGQEDEFARKIVTRVRNMCQFNRLPNVEELQLDCDWTKSTELSFFSLCNSVRQAIADLDLSYRLSSTIRLHQLSRPTPPVDSGVLMVYNTGNFSNPDTPNSIIDAADVEPYLKHLDSYPLHLDIAYPTYSWQLLFRKRKFIGLLNNVNLSDSTCFAPCTASLYTARKDLPYNNRTIRAGDVIRRESSDFDEINKARKLIERRLDGRRHSNILYHLDSENLSKYTDSEINTIFSTSF